MELPEVIAHVQAAGSLQELRRGVKLVSIPGGRKHRREMEVDRWISN
jgi:hypothetical protein